MDTEHDRSGTAPGRLADPPRLTDGAPADLAGGDGIDAEGLRWEVVDTPQGLDQAVEALAAAEGPFAVDSERAGGYRYSQRAYLVQVRRGDSDVFLIDPVPFAGLDPLAELLGSDEWILHAASQDLPCLTELGLVPPSLFDTELAGRLLGKERVGLGPLLAETLDVHLAKQHSAADWSSRPLPNAWLEYAALDVQYLADLRSHLIQELQDSGKDEWARQEFMHELEVRPRGPRPEPWRRTSRIADARSRRSLAVVRELWTVRDEIARELDRAPGRLVNDRAIMALATRDPLPRSLPVGRTFRVQRARWEEAYARALALDASELPPRRGPRHEGLPDPRNWKNVNPEAAERLTLVKATIGELAEEYAVPQENLLSPAIQRAIAWQSDDVREALEQTDARPWQIDLVAPAVTEALQA